jgi:1-acyl-sn-glycerol-3-phosphate acyltransferase
MRQLGYVWRVFATHLAFLIFNVGGLIFGGTAILICSAIPGTRAAREARMQRVVHWFFRVFIALLVGLGLLTYSRRNMERLRTGRACLVIANHPTLIDVVFLIAAMPRVDCVVKSAVWKNVFMRAAVRGAGYISNHEGPELVDDCVERLARGHHVLLFPEGTRSPERSLRRFQRGAARVALRSRCDIVPIVITCDPPTLLKGMRWHDVPKRRPHFTLVVEPPISPVPFLVDGQDSAAGARALTADLEGFFGTRLGCTIA